MEKVERVILVGLDLDGVVAKHSLGGFWVNIRRLKEKFLKKLHTHSYYYPKSPMEKEAWKLINWLRVPNKDGIERARKLQKNGWEFFLITGRFKFNYPLTIKWLEKYQLLSLFKKVLVNVEDENPTIFKEKSAAAEQVDYFIDDDLEVLNALYNLKAKLYWVVPGHRDSKENGNKKIVSCQSFSEALEKIAASIKENSF